MPEFQYSYLADQAFSTHSVIPKELHQSPYREYIIKRQENILVKMSGRW